MKIVIDRIEGELAVCELPNGTMANLPLSLFENAEEGDVYEIKKDTCEREARTSRARALFERLKITEEEE